MATAESTPGEAAPALQEEPLLDVNVLKEIAQKSLVDALNAVNGAKTLVLDATLAGPLGLVTEVSLLKVRRHVYANDTAQSGLQHHGVDKMFWLEGGPLTSTTTNIVYLCRPKIKHIKIIADQIKRHAKEGQQHTYTLLLVPRISTLATRILEEEGVLGDVHIASYNLQFIPIADDVISLENEMAFKEIWVDGDETAIYDSAQALVTLEKLYGLFPRIVAKGDHAARLSTLLGRPLPTDAAAPDLLQTQSEKIDSLIILDRRVDMITPLLTQLTYEGLTDELIGIKNSHVELPVSLLSPPAPGANVNPPAAPVSSLKKVEAKKKHHLSTSTDPLFAELRDLNFSAIGRRLNKVARRLDEDYKGRHQAKTVAQLRDFVGKLGGLQSEHQSLRLHTGLSEIIVPMTRTDIFNKTLEIQQNLLASYEVSNQITAIEDLIAQGADMQTVLRLLCLASITAGGIKPKPLENLKREILQAYGYNFLPLLLAISSHPLAILLPNIPATPASDKYPFSAVRKSLRLLIDDTPEALDEVENDISFVYSGYAPISVRLVQCVAQKGGVLSNPAEKEKAGVEQTHIKAQAHPIAGWRGFEDIVATIPGETVDVVQSGTSTTPAPMASLLRPMHKPTTTLVFFLGGCTYTEIAALRWVGRQNKGRKFLIATTGIINGRNMFESIVGAPSASAPASKDVAI
ncbi:unnamed protein product [Mycena citricolor]|uniref:ATP binding protein n=1 Tax=Mycena citricolor TaxID=2018698 RepID=A0AAD2HSS3_9AGAR|nr:unnamed protein product [Mycena citricolor]